MPHPPKKTPSTRRKGIVIRTPVATMPSAKEEEDEPIPGIIDPTLLATDIPLASLSKDEQLALAVKASADMIPEERAARVASFIYYRFTVGLLPGETSRSRWLGSQRRPWRS